MQFTVQEQATINEAVQIIERKFDNSGFLINEPDLAGKYLVPLLAPYEHEVFFVLFLSNQHRVLAGEVLFTGTIDGAAVYPREVVKAALKHNAAAVILAHNHPSGNATPSESDKQITARLVDALSLVEIRVLDHILVAGAETVSFANRGLI